MTRKQKINDLVTQLNQFNGTTDNPTKPGTFVLDNVKPGRIRFYSLEQVSSTNTGTSSIVQGLTSAEMHQFLIGMIYGWVSGIHKALEHKDVII
ncbi:MAG: hypothetical protein CTY12_00445 [Methylotenera sp.]|nr:MAG: hypothetical protein CTY12_00445 [Methylotenera sp.]